jgi:hypothetical protein
MQPIRNQDQEIVGYREPAPGGRCELRASGRLPPEAPRRAVDGGRSSAWSRAGLVTSSLARTFFQP